MPYISEIHFLTGDAWVEAEFVEITLGPDENPADYTLSFYGNTGSLKTTITGNDPNSGSTSNVVTNGEVNLASLVGVPDPDNPDFTIYILSGTVGGNKLLNGGATGGEEANYVSLFDINTGSLVNAYGIANNPARTLSGGAADGQTATTTSGWPSSGQSYHFDAFGNATIAARSSGDAVTCFDERTWILTPKGERSLKNLRVGDLVETLDDGAQPVRWIGVTECSGLSVAKAHHLKPVRIPKDFFGPGRPNRTLRVSRQHRLLVQCPSPFPPDVEDGALVPAIRLADLSGISVQRRPREITYRHLMFDRHQIICANGIPAESFLACAGAISALPKAAQQDVKAFVDEGGSMRAARTIIERRAQFLQFFPRHHGAKTLVPPWPTLQTCSYSAASA